MTKERVCANDEDRPEATDLDDDLAELHALSFAIETCADVLIGLLSPETARQALPVLTRIQQTTLDRVRDHIERLEKVS